MPGRRQRHALVVQLVRDEVPAPIDAGDDGVVTDAHVVVEGRRRRRVHHRVDLRVREAGVGRRHEEDRDALVLRRVRIGAGREPDVVGVRREGREDLLAVDDPLVAVLHGSGAQRGQVGAGAGFGVTDREVQLAGEDLRKELRLLLLGTELHDRLADGVDREERDRHPGAPRLVGEDELLEVGAALAAVLLGPADTEPTVAAHRAQPRGTRGPPLSPEATSASTSGVMRTSKYSRSSWRSASCSGV